MALPTIRQGHGAIAVYNHRIANPGINRADSGRGLGWSHKTHPTPEINR